MPPYGYNGFYGVAEGLTKGKLVTDVIRTMSLINGLHLQIPIPWWRHQRGNIFRVNGPLWGESTGHRWIPLTKDNDAELWFFFFDLRLNKRFSK